MKNEGSTFISRLIHMFQRGKSIGIDGKVDHKFYGLGKGNFKQNSRKELKRNRRNK